MNQPVLDPLMQQEVYKLLHEAKAAGTTIFFSSHIISEVEAIAERLVIIRDGVIIEEAAPEQLVNMKLRRYRIRFRKAVPPVEVINLAGVTLIDQPNENEIILQIEGEVDQLIKTLASYPVSDCSRHCRWKKSFWPTIMGKRRKHNVG